MSIRPAEARAPATPAPGKLPITELAEMKRAASRSSMVTAYDAPWRADSRTRPERDLVLVGDSAAMTVLGHDSTVPATMDEMLILTRAVTRGAQRPLVDRRHAVRLVPGLRRGRGSQRDPLREGGRRGRGEARRRGHACSTRVRAIVDAGIPVMGHIGLTPQSATTLGGFKAQGRTAERPLRARPTTPSRSRRPAASRSCSRRCPRRSQLASRAMLVDSDDRHRRGSDCDGPGARLARPARPLPTAAHRASSSATPRSETTIRQALAAFAADVRGASTAFRRSSARTRMPDDELAHLRGGRVRSSRARRRAHARERDGAERWRATSVRGQPQPVHRRARR